MLTPERKREICNSLFTDSFTPDAWLSTDSTLLYCYVCEEEFWGHVKSEITVCPVCQAERPVFNPLLAMGHVPADGFQAGTNGARKAQYAHTMIEFQPREDFGKPRPEATINFGKYKGFDLEDVPDSYLKWVLQQEWFDGEDWERLRGKVEDELEYREEYGVNVK